MNFKDALLINEGIILEATPERYLNAFIKNNYDLTSTIKFNDRIIGSEPIATKFGLVIPNNDDDIPLGKGETRQIINFRDRVIELAKEKELSNNKIITLTNCLNDFSKKVNNYKK